MNYYEDQCQRDERRKIANGKEVARKRVSKEDVPDYFLDQVIKALVYGGWK